METDDDLARAVGRAWLDDAPWELLTDLTAIPDRLAGGPGERRGAELTAAALADAGGRAVAERPFDLQRWRRGTSTLAVTTPDERSFETLALPYSPAGSVEGPLVDAGAGTPEAVAGADLAGAIAVVSTETPADFPRFLHREEKYGHVVDAGAAGFVFANHEGSQLLPTGSLRFDREAELPAVGVSRETGAWLREYAGRGGRARLTVDAETEPGESRNVEALLGPDTDEEVVVCAHHDAHDVGEGALDNGCGVATLVGAARLLAALDVDCRVRLVTTGGEELGLLGAASLADRLDPGTVRAVVNVDGAGRFRTLRALTHTSDALAQVASELGGRVGHPIETTTRPHPFSDHWPFLRRGVPALQLHSSRERAGDTWSRGVTHTRADTRDKADGRILREHAILTALLVRALTRRPVPRPASEAVREALAAQELDVGMRAIGIWPDGWD